MVYAMDTLGYSKRLRDAGIPQQEAEAHAEAARDFIMTELVTKTDLQTHLQILRSDLETSLHVSRSDLETSLQAFKRELKADLQVVKSDLEGKVQGLKAELKSEWKADLHALETKLSLRLGVLMAAGIAVVATVVKLI